MPYLNIYLQPSGDDYDNKLHWDWIFQVTKGSHVSPCG